MVEIPWAVWKRLTGLWPSVINMFWMPRPCSIRT